MVDVRFELATKKACSAIVTICSGYVAPIVKALVKALAFGANGLTNGDDEKTWVWGLGSRV